MRRFSWITYAFGALLVFSGVKLLRQGEDGNQSREESCSALVPASFPGHEGICWRAILYAARGKIRLYATPLLVVLLVVETSDILFAVDSIPAVLAITMNAFIVYTSNVFAILGLRSMYFALAGMMDLFHYLHYGLVGGADFYRDQNAGVALREHSHRMGAGDRCFWF